MQKRLTKKEQAQNDIIHERNVVQLRSQMPLHNEFYELFQKFKLCLNLLVKFYNNF